MLFQVLEGAYGFVASTWSLEDAGWFWFEWRCGLAEPELTNLNQHTGRIT